VGDGKPIIISMNVDIIAVTLVFYFDEVPHHFVM